MVGNGRVGPTGRGYAGEVVNSCSATDKSSVSPESEFGETAVGGVFAGEQTHEGNDVPERVIESDGSKLTSCRGSRIERPAAVR